MKNSIVAVEASGKIEVHISAVTGNYYTLCGMDGDDPSLGVEQKVVIVLPGERITCRHCYQMWQAVHNMSESDFDDSLCVEH